MEKQVICLAAVAIVVAIFVILSSNKRQISESFGGAAKRQAIVESRPPRQYNEFFIYNYYNVPICVGVVNYADKRAAILARNVPVGGKIGISLSKSNEWMVKYNAVKIYREQDMPHNFGEKPKFEENAYTHLSTRSDAIGESILTIPPNTSTKALHCGMNVGSDDIALSSDPVKSPLGTALSRLRIVNTSPQTLRLTTTGNDFLIIPPGKSYLYYGLWANGIPLGTEFKDVEGIIPSYRVLIPITDLFMGVISDIAMPLYNDIKVGLAYNDAPGIVNNALEIHDIQSHKGMLIDPTYIPKNW